jgi:hypothetical protein
MSTIRQQYDDEFRKNAVILSYAMSKTIKALADYKKHDYFMDCDAYILYSCYISLFLY